MKSLKKFSKRLMKNQRGQGIVEYVLLLVVVVAVVLMFKGPLLQMVKGKISELEDGVSGVTTGEN